MHGVSDAELVEIMGSAEVACVPSLYEGFSLPTAELMACGTPLVVSDAGAIPEVVGPDGLCADLVPPGDVEALAGALARLLDDPERRARYGAAGRARVERAVQLAGRRGRDRRGVRGGHRGGQGPCSPLTSTGSGCCRATGPSTWAAAPDGTRSRCTAVAPT